MRTYIHFRTHISCGHINKRSESRLEGKERRPKVYNKYNRSRREPKVQNQSEVELLIADVEDVENATANTGRIAVQATSESQEDYSQISRHTVKHMCYRRGHLNKCLFEAELSSRNTRKGVLVYIDSIQRHRRDRTARGQALNAIYGESVNSFLSCLPLNGVFGIQTPTFTDRELELL